MRHWLSGLMFCSIRSKVCPWLAAGYVLITLTSCDIIKEIMPKPMPEALPHGPSAVVSSDRETKLQAEENSAIAGSSVVAPPGVLAVQSEIRMQEGEPLANDINAETLALDGMEGAGPTVNLRLEPEATPQGALSIEIPLYQGSGLHLTADTDDLIVIYKVKNQTGNIVLGVLPPSMLTVQDNSVQFATSLLGSYQAVYLTSGEVTTVMEVPVTSPILVKDEIPQNPIRWLHVNAVVQDKSSAHFEGALEGMQTIDACVIVVDRDKVAPWDMRVRIVKPSYRFAATQDGSYQARFQCSDSAGRVSPLSPWSPLVSLASPTAVRPVKPSDPTTDSSTPSDAQDEEQEPDEEPADEEQAPDEEEDEQTPNTAPTIVSSNSAAVAENETAVLTASAFDADGDAIEWRITGGADWGLFVVDASTGDLTFSTAPDYEADANGGGDNIYVVELTASDGKTTTPATITVNVTNVNEPPVITSSATASADENQTFVLSAAASDPEGDEVSWAIDSGADAANFSIDGSGNLTFNSTPNFEAPTDADTDGVYVVSIVASDASAEELQTISVTVANLNEAPTITSSLTPSSFEGATSVMTVTATDPEADTIVWSVVSGTDQSLFAIDEETGALEFTVTPNFETPTDTDTDGVYQVKVKAYDGALYDQQYIDVTVTDLSEPPMIVTTGPFPVIENQTSVTTAFATDPEDDTITWSLDGDDSSLFMIDGNSGALTFIVAPDFDQPTDNGGDNTYNLDLVATDSTANFASLSIIVNVTDMDEAPTITSSSTQNVAENQTTVMTLAASDPEFGTITWEIVNGGYDEAFFALDPNTGVLTFLAGMDYESASDADVNNTYIIEVGASDGTNSVTQTITVTVTDAVEPTQLKFTNADLNQDVGACGALVIEAQAGDGSAVNVGATTNIELSSQSLDYEFFAAGDCDGTAITQIELHAGNSSVSVLYKDNVVGSVFIGADETPSQGWTAASQEAFINALPSPDFVQIAAAQNHSCALTVDGSAYCWGRGIEGQLGDGSASDSAVPILVNTTSIPGTKEFRRITVGTNHTCGITSDGKAYCWGYNDVGQLGAAGNPNDSPTPLAVDTSAFLGSKEFVDIVAANLHTCGVVTDGTVYCWGSDLYGQLGNGAGGSSAVPIVIDTSSVTGSTQFVQITAGVKHSCGMTSDSNVYCWGNDSYGQLGNGASSSSTIPYPVDVAPLSSTLFTKIVANGFHTCGIARDGKPYCWGQNTYGKLGNGNTTNQPSPALVDTSAVGEPNQFVELTAGLEQTCGITSDGKAYCWGQDSSGQLGNDASLTVQNTPAAVDDSSLPMINNFRGIAGGGGHTCALTNDGQAYCWGGNANGQLGDAFPGTPSPTPVPVASSGLAVPSYDPHVQVGSGDDFSCAISSEGKATCWGADTYGQLGDGGVTTNSSSPVAVDTSSMPGAQEFLQLTIGRDHACGITTDRNVFCWGRNNQGQLGEGSEIDLQSPATIDTSSFLGATEFLQISAGLAHTCGVAVDGKAYCWGYNGYGQLGDNSFTSSSIPVEIDTTYTVGTKQFLSITAGDDHTCAITTDGKAHCWGLNFNGQLGNNTDSDSKIPMLVSVATIGGSQAFVQINAGSSHTCAIMADGAAYCWGSNASGQLGDGTTTQALEPSLVDNSNYLGPKQFVQITVGKDFSCGTTSDGKAHCWGANGSGQLGDGTQAQRTIPTAVDVSSFPGTKEFLQISAGGTSTCGITSDAKTHCWGENGNGQLGVGDFVDTSLPAIVSPIL